MKSTIIFCECGKAMEPDYNSSDFFQFKCQDSDCDNRKSKHKSELHPIMIAKFSGIKK